MDISSDIEKRREKFEKSEALCKHCGACCGAFGDDPCVNLAVDGNEKYYCQVYSKRIGLQKTKSSKAFACIPMQVYLKFNQPFKGCVYTLDQEELDTNGL